MATIGKNATCIVYTRTKEKEVKIKVFKTPIGIFKTNGTEKALTCEITANMDEVVVYLNEVIENKDLYEEISIRFEDDHVLTFDLEKLNIANNNNK